jgi:hypothetical protein
MSIGLQNLHGNMIITSPQKELDLVFDTQSYMKKFFNALGLNMKPAHLGITEFSSNDEVPYLTFTIREQIQQWGVWELQNQNTLDLFSYARLLSPVKTNIVVMPVLDIHRFSPLLAARDNIDIREKMLRGQKLHCEGRIISPIALYASHLAIFVVYISDVRQDIKDIAITLEIPNNLKHMAVTYSMSDLGNIRQDLNTFLQTL